jgi:IS5 family transposase
MIEMRRKQLRFGDGLIAEEVSDLRENWMPHADEVLADEEIVAIVYEAMVRRHPKSRCRGRHGAPAEMVLRLLVLKHIRNWSYQVLEREVRCTETLPAWAPARCPMPRRWAAGAWRSDRKCSNRFTSGS